MGRCKVYVEAGNDFREVSIGGRRGNPDSGFSWINFDWFKLGTVKRPDKRFKKQEVLVEKIEKIYEGTNSVRTSVYRDDDGSVNVHFKFNECSKIPKDVARVHLDFDGLSMHFDVADIRLIKEYLRPDCNGLEVLAVVGMIPDICRIVNAETPEEREAATKEFIQKRDGVGKIIDEYENQQREKWEGK